MSKATTSFPFRKETHGWVVSHVRRLPTPLSKAVALKAMDAISYGPYFKAVFEVNRDQVAGSSQTPINPSRAIYNGTQVAGG